MTQMFKASSTKLNFMFLCNACLTLFEMNQEERDSVRLSKLDNNMTCISEQLQEIKTLVYNQSPSVHKLPNVSSLPYTSVWLNTERLANVKAKPSESVLLVNKADGDDANKANTEIIENLVVTNKIAVSDSYTNKKGNLVVVCQNPESSDQLKQHVSTANGDITLHAPKEKTVLISIVGLNKCYTKEEVAELIVSQNIFLKSFFMKNKPADHLNVFAVKALRNNPQKF